MRRFRSVLSIGVFGCTLLASCRGASDLPVPSRSGSTDKQGAELVKAASAPPVVVQQPLGDLTLRCTLNQSGLVIDLGSKAAEAHRLFRLAPDDPPEFSMRLGESFRKIERTRTDFVFWLTEEMNAFDFRARVHGRLSNRMAVYLDGARLGAARLRQDETRLVQISGGEKTLSSGIHRLTVALSRTRAQPPSVEMGWLRLGSSDLRELDFPAMRREVFSEVTIAGERQASVVLRPRSSLRCPIWLAPQSQFRTKLGIWGEGVAEVEVIIHTGEGERVVVARARREKDEDREFQSLTADLSRFGSQLVDIELSSSHGQGDARIALSQPVLESSIDSVERSPQAKRAIVVVLSGLGEEHSPPQAGERGLPFLNQLAQDATSYVDYRASTTSASGVMASLLTGLAPWQHGLSSHRDALLSRFSTLAAAVEAGGGRSGYFTGVPTGFAAFGFDRGFEAFSAVAPQADEPATAPLDLAKSWIESGLKHEGPLLAIVQLRGGHPPFDISREKARELPPDEYGGHLTPRRAALQLLEIRERRRRSHRRMPTEDWVRLAALRKAALLRQSIALSSFIAWLRERDAYDDTLLIVMGDVGAGERPAIPYSAQAKLEEGNLAVPLLVKFPQKHQQGAHVEGFFAPRDVSATLRNSLGLEELDGTDGIDLGESNAMRRARLRPHIAYRNHEYSLRLGSALLRGIDGTRPLLCRPALDPSCQVDRSTTEVMAARALWLSAWSELSGALSVSAAKNPRPEDPVLENALTVWGVAE